MFIGPTPLDQEIAAIVISRVADVPTAAIGSVTFRIYDGATLLATATATAFDSGHLTGAYRCAVTPTEGAGYARGRKYDLIASWTTSGGNREEVYTFRTT